MDDILGKVVAMLLAAAIFVGIPVCYMGPRAKSAEQLYLLSVNTEFVDSVCNVGFVDFTMYQQFLKEVALARGVYDVRLQHEQKELLLNGTEYSYVSTFYDEEDVLEQLNKGEKYYLSQGDYLRVQIVKDADSYLAGMLSDSTSNVFYGGTVRYEAY